MPTKRRAGWIGILAARLLLPGCAAAIADNGPSTQPTAFFLVGDRYTNYSLVKAAPEESGYTVVLPPSNDLDSFSVSSDGLRLVCFHSFLGERGVGPPSHEEFDVIAPDGRSIKTLPWSGPYITWLNGPPVFLPDGKHIGFAAVIHDPLEGRNGGGGGPQGVASIASLFTVDIESGKYTIVATASIDHPELLDASYGERLDLKDGQIESISHPNWSADGKTILLTVKYGNGARLWQMDFDGRNPHEIASDERREGAFSPDGRQIAYLHGEELWVSAADGGNARMLTQMKPLIASPRWLADGKTIEFYREDRPIIFGSIWLIDLDGSLRRVNSSENAHIDEQNEIG